MQWISVEEGLPEDRRHYLTACTWNEMRWVTKLLWDGYRFRVKQEGSVVTHWQPLPDPPKSSGPSSSSGLKCPHCGDALRLEQYVSYYAIRDTKVCPYCGKVMQIGHRLAKADA